MNDQEWGQCTDPMQMLAYLDANANARKPLLLACACHVRLRSYLPESVPHLSSSLRDWHVVAFEVAEGRRDTVDLCLGCAEWLEEYHSQAYARAPIGVKGALHALWDVISGAWKAEGAVMMCPEDGDSGKGWEAERLVHVEFVRDIFGNPFRPVAVDPAWLAWRDGTCPKIAQRIYDERAFADLPILADALEEAGCRSAELLAHCRHPAPHVRGCWAVDLILGKT